MLPSPRNPVHPAAGIASSRLVPILAVLFAFWAGEGAAQAPATGGGIREGALRVFLDCNAFPCDSDDFRTEIGFVNWVRDRTRAQLHLIVTSSQTGGGGNEYALDFLGLGELAGDDDRLSLTTLSTDSESELLDAITSVMAAGLAGYSAAIGQPVAFLVLSADLLEPDTDLLVSASQQSDPWNFWVFKISSDLELQGEDSERERSYSGSVEASRTTEMWKVELEAEGSFSRDERDRSSGETIVDERTNWSTDFLVARTLAEHWSLGAIAGAGASTRLNQELGADVALAIEYSLPLRRGPPAFAHRPA